LQKSKSCVIYLSTGRSDLAPLRRREDCTTFTGPNEAQSFFIPNACNPLKSPDSKK
jgi:hypothetical protein